MKRKGLIFLDARCAVMCVEVMRNATRNLKQDRTFSDM